MYTNIIHIKWLLYYWRCSFSGLELHKQWVVSYGPNHASWSLSNTPFCVVSSMKTKGSLQLYYTLYDSSTTEDVSFHVESSKTVTNYNNEPTNQLRKYKAEHSESLDSLEHLKWWKTKEQQLKYLSWLMKQVLCVTASSVPSKLLFSSAKNLVNETRSCLSPKVLTIFFSVWISLPNIVLLYYFFVTCFTKLMWGSEFTPYCKKAIYCNT